ncbi:hypothetical protein A3G16_03330 [Candidatus Curtissbacteria bacterium RIFCSPLOWO2_12_FULL_41_16]|nr:MAG: hypothetical protein A3E71_00235 [Candidatus Curtissbacteria bacterium RIFCSPHIGHO2_12_FULL_42_33]OGE02535.1 MAG: hypothetical protein A3G16_03330 [Candidatus Curtissbacteria bacterium RIFCSPLOWO2_12_FULL_41_16]
MVPLATHFEFKKALFFVLAILALYLFYNLLYVNKIFPNIYFADLSLSGKNREQVSQLVSWKIDSFEKSRIVLSVGEEKIVTDLKTLGIEFDKEAAVSSIFLTGRTGNLKNDLTQKLKAPLAKTIILPIYQIDWQKLSALFSSILAKYEVPAADATIIFKDGRWQIQEESPGKVVDKTRLAALFYDRIENLSEVPIEVPLVQELPKMKTVQAETALWKVQMLSNQRIVLSFERMTWELSGKTLFSILKFFPQGIPEGNVWQINFGTEPILFKRITLEDSNDPLLDVGLYGTQLEDFVNRIAEGIDKPTINAMLRFESGKVIEFTPAQDGQKLDKRLTSELINDKISINGVAADDVVGIDLPVKVTRAKIESDRINSLGIRELLGRGVSYFAGSIQNRVHNLTLGATRISGTIVAPGEIFSFNNSIGEVSGATGYKQAYVISSGRTVLDDGGGICQVSTTVFRAALLSGLPVVARTAHAYRVGYYEQGGFKAGLDATVWAPAVDFQFKNDTNQHILVQATVDAVNAKLQVDIYGTSDERRVEMTEPVISNQIRPPPDKYQDDPALSRGTVKQVDFAAWGATSVFARKVYIGNRLVIDESFRSVFRPWQAVYLVGTGG